MDTVKTAIGKKFESDYLSAIPFPPQIYVRVLNASLVDVAAVFGNAEETRQLWYNEQYFAMYTKLVAIVPEPGAIKVVLAKEG